MLPSKSFPINYSLIIPAFNLTNPKLLKQWNLKGSEGGVTALGTTGFLDSIHLPEF
jgi:hypothetical protein